jgi:hypothetical protein
MCKNMLVCQKVHETAEREFREREREREDLVKWGRVLRSKGLCLAH